MNYDFASRRNPRKTAQQHFQERRARRQRKLCKKGCPVTLNGIVDVGNLIRAHKANQAKGQAPGVDGVAYAHLAPSEVGTILRDISQAILRGTWRPDPVRLAQIPKANGAFRTLRIGTIWNRAVSSALKLALDSHWERTFLPCSFGFRPGQGTWTMLATLEALRNTTGHQCLAVADVQRAFENVPLDAALNCHANLLEALPFKGRRGSAEKRRILAFVDRVMRGAEDPKRERGIHQGDNYSPTVLNALFHFFLDAPICDTLKSPVWLRYADNVAIVSPTVSMGRDLLHEAEQRLAPLGMSLRDASVHDLTYDEVELLGFTLRAAGTNLALLPSKKAWDSLARSLEHAHGEDDPPLLARQVLRGWIEHLGPTQESGAALIPKALQLAADCGFRELARPEAIHRWLQQSSIGWQRAREHGADRANVILASLGGSAAGLT